MYAHACLCAGIPEPTRGERGWLTVPSAVSDQLTALVSQAYQRGENSSCFSTASEQLAVLASSPEKGFLCAAGGLAAARSSSVRRRLAWGGAVIGRSAETEDIAVVRVRQYRLCNRQYSTVVCVDVQAVYRYTCGG